MKSRALPVGLLLAWFCAFAAAPEVVPALASAFYAMDTAFERPGLDPAQQLALVKELGFDGIAWHEQPPEEAKAAALAAERNGLRMFTIYCGGQVTPEGGLSYSPSLPALMAALKGHGTLIWLHLGGKGPAIASLSGNEPVVAKLRGLAAIAAENDTRIALYPHVGEWTERFGDATRLAKVVNHPALGVTFNLCHCLATGDEKRIPALLEEAAPVLLTATINGADAGVAQPDWSRLIQRLDQGSFEVGAVLRKLEQIGFTGPVGFQGYGLKGSARSILEPTMARWRQLEALAMEDAARRLFDSSIPHWRRPAASLYGSGFHALFDRWMRTMTDNSSLSLSGSGFHLLFDGKTFDGWEGDTNHTWRLEHGEIVGGSLTAGVPRNEFLCTTRPFTNFVLGLRFKLTGKSGFINGGVQFRSRRVANPPNEMAGYQADIGDPDYWGSIYDEGMRNKTLAKADMDALNRVLRRNDWNEYLIRAEGRRVRLWINDLQTVDYTEPDERRAQWGVIGLQIHGGAVAEARYRDLLLEELPADPAR